VKHCRQHYNGGTLDKKKKIKMENTSERGGMKIFGGRGKIRQGR
jgi:hypothetical protein